MVKGIGTDIEEVKRFKAASAQFLRRVFTAHERAYCDTKAEPWIHYAGTFCAKEAVVKAFAGKVSLLEVEIRRKKSGQPVAFVKGRLRPTLHLSISHTFVYAVAFAVLR